MLWDGNQSKSRKQAVATFRLETGHECLAKHLHLFNILPSANCKLCRLPNTVMDYHHLRQSVVQKDNDSRDMAELKSIFCQDCNNVSLRTLRRNANRE